MHPSNPLFDPLRGDLVVALTVRRTHNRLAVTGDLDLATRDRLDRVLRWLDHGARPLRLDLGDVGFVDCAGWRVVDDAMQRRRARRAAGIEVVTTSRQVQRFLELFAMTGGHDAHQPAGGWLRAAG